MASGGMPTPVSVTRTTSSFVASSAVSETADRSAGGGVFDGVGDEVQGGLVDHVAVGFDGEEDGHELVDERDLFFAGGGHGDFQHLLEDAVEGDGLFVDAIMPDSMREMFKMLSIRRREAFGFGLDDVIELGAGFVVGGFAIDEHFGIGLDAGEGRAEFVRNVGDEVRLHLGDFVFAGAVVQHGDHAGELIGVVHDAGERDGEGAQLAVDFEAVFGGAAVGAGGGFAAFR